MTSRENRLAAWRGRGQAGPRGRAEPAYDGRLQGIANGYAVGWAWDRRDQDRRLRVAIEIDGELVAEGIADVERQELIDEGIGDGAHGFRVMLPEHVQATEHVQLLAVAGPELVVLPKSDSFWQEADDDSPWSAVTFYYGRAGDPESDAELPVKVPPPPGQEHLLALAGKDGWLFALSEVDVEDEPQPPPDAVAALADRLHAHAEAFKAIGVAYVVACAPRKLQTLRTVAPLEVTRSQWLAELTAVMRDTDDAEILDLLPIVEDARRHGPCYQRTDVDWNARCAFFVARALIKEARKRVATLRLLSLAELHLITRAGYRGALADVPKYEIEGTERRAVELEVESEETIEADFSKLTAERMPVDRHLVTGGDIHVRLFTQSEPGSDVRLAVIGDDACLPLLPWLAEAASRTTFFWTLVPPMRPVELELPEVVIHVVRDRDLPMLALSPAAGGAT